MATFSKQDYVVALLNKSLAKAAIDAKASEIIFSWVNRAFPSDVMQSERNMLNKKQIYLNLVYLRRRAREININVFDIGFLEVYIQ